MCDEYQELKTFGIALSMLAMYLEITINLTVVRKDDDWRISTEFWT